MKLRAVFWPILVIMGVPYMTFLYWEPGTASYPTKEQCEARLPALEKMARADDDFLIGMRTVNGGDVPFISFSRECIDVPPREYEQELKRNTDEPDRRS
jgi:hypothetical protein